MRSKEVDEAIKLTYENLNQDKNELIRVIEYKRGDTMKEYLEKEIKRSETLLAYISELEKENAKYKNFQLHINGMRNGKELLIKYINDSVLKEDIRDKIKVLEGCIEEFKPQGYIEGELKAKIEVLKELLEGE